MTASNTINRIGNLRVHDVRCNPGDSGFLLEDDNTAILYDSGFGFTGFGLAEKIKKVLGDRKLDYIFLTHSHYDHVVGSAYVRRIYPEVKVVAGEYTSYVFSREGALKVMRELDAKAAKDAGVAEYDFLGEELKVDVCCKEGDKIIAGNYEFEVFELPGHTKCSIGFYCKALKLFLGSETLGVYDGDRTIVPVFLVGFEDAVNSGKKVCELEIEYMLSPHLGLLDKAHTAFYLQNINRMFYEVFEEIKGSLLANMSDELIIENFKKKYWNGYIREIYPEAAIDLNTGIVIDLIRKSVLD